MLICSKCSIIWILQKDFKNLLQGSFSARDNSIILTEGKCVTSEIMLTSANCIAEIWKGVIYCISEGYTEFNVMRLWGERTSCIRKKHQPKEEFVAPTSPSFLKFLLRTICARSRKGVDVRKQLLFKSPGKNREKAILSFIKIIVSFFKNPSPLKNNQIRFFKKLDLSLSWDTPGSLTDPLRGSVIGYSIFLFCLISLNGALYSHTIQI